jgi:aminoglycoside phosphotransferase family enzyme/predicted kinase
MVEQLMSPAAFDYPLKSIERIETHISWVILTDRYAYKIKKPLQLDFLDFSSLERRHYFCEEELRLNRAWASDIYLDVVAITDDAGQATFSGSGKVIDYAVRMRRFEQDMRLDRQLALGELTESDMRDLGKEVATRHIAAAVVSSKFRQRVLAMTSQQMRDNFTALDGYVEPPALALLREWTEAELHAKAGTIEQRFDAGFTRDCHGDLHLANLVRMPDGIRAFDCIEFNADLRRIDVFCDIAFLVMDLLAKERPDLAAYFLNRYLEHGGDYAGVDLLDMYFVYRCLVRAKVAVISSQECDAEKQRLLHIAEANRYCRIASQQTRKPAPTLVIMSGLSGSGKSWVSARLMAALPAIRLRSDLERKRLFGLSATADSHSDINKGIYARHSSSEVYEYLIKTAKLILTARHHVILDATFLHAADRSLALDMADSCGFAAVIVAVHAPLKLMRQRLQDRAAAAIDVSEAGLEVLEHQRSVAQPPTAEELERTIQFENVGQPDINGLLAATRRSAESFRHR